MWVLATFPVRLTAPTDDTEKSALGNEATPVTLEVAKGAVYCVMLEATVICLPVWVMVMPDPEVIETPPVIPLIPLTPLPKKGMTPPVELPTNSLWSGMFTAISPAVSEGTAAAVSERKIRIVLSLGMI